MTTRQFDPVFSAALRNELEALADAPAPKEATGLLPALRRPQVWISIVTAAVLVAATIGVLQVTRGAEPDPAGRSLVVDPLTEVTDPGSGQYVARQVRTLLHVRAQGPGTHDFAVPAGVTSVRILLNCAPTGNGGVGFDGDGEVSGRCTRSSGSSADVPIRAGAHDVRVAVAHGADYALLIIASPAPTVSTGALIDPLAEVRDLRNPDALVGDTAPVLRLAGAGSSTTAAVRPGVRLRAYLVCRTSSGSAEAVVDGHAVRGCMNSIAHWFDFTPAAGSIRAGIVRGDGTRLLVVPAPAGAKDSPAQTLLPLPERPTGATVLAQARGAGEQVVGTLPATRASGIDVGVTCRGSGWLEVATPQGSVGPGSTCDVAGRFATGIGGGATKRAPYSVTPHGDITWTVTITAAG